MNIRIFLLIFTCLLRLLVIAFLLFIVLVLLVVIVVLIVLVIHTNHLQQQFNRLLDGIFKQFVM